VSCAIIVGVKLWRVNGLSGSRTHRRQENLPPAGFGHGARFSGEVSKFLALGVQYFPAVEQIANGRELDRAVVCGGIYWTGCDICPKKIPPGLRTNHSVQQWPISEIIRGTKSLNQYLTAVKRGLRKTDTAAELTESLISSSASPHPLDVYLNWQQ
jgi:hypothetical protein